MHVPVSGRATDPAACSWKANVPAFVMVLPVMLTLVIELPMSENVWPVNSSRKSRSRRAPNMLGREASTPSLPLSRTAPLAAPLPFPYFRQHPVQT